MGRPAAPTGAPKGKTTTREKRKKKLGHQIAKTKLAKRVKQSKEDRRIKSERAQTSGSHRRAQPVLTRHLKEVDAGPSERMDVDAFLEGGFLEGMGKTAPRTKKGVPTKPAKAVANPVKAAAGGGKARSHKDELEALKQTDPEFFKYLQQTDKSLLEFEDGDDDLDEDDDKEASEDEEDEEDEASEDQEDEEADEEVDEESDDVDGEDGDGLEAEWKDDDDDDDDEDDDVEAEGAEEEMLDMMEDEEDEEDEGGAKPARRAVELKEVTTGMVKQWQRILLKGESTPALKEAISAFRCAVHFGDEQADSGKDVEQYSYTFTSGHVFDLLMQFCLRHMDTILRRHAAGSLEAADAAKKTKTGADRPDQWKHWRRHQPLVKSFLMQLLHFLSKMSDPQMSAVLLRQLHRCLGFFYVFPKLSPKLLKSLVRVWSLGISQTVTLLSFAMIRELAINLPYPFVENCLKSTYLAFASACKFTSRKTLQHVALMSACVVDTCGLDMQVAYQHAFVYIRQLAIHLRNAIQQRTEAAYRQVYNWQYINCLRVWAQVLVTHARAPTAPLRQLVYPLMQVTFGAAKLLPNIRFAPLRFQCARIANQLCAELGIYAPVAPLLLDVFRFHELSKTPKGNTTERPIDWAVLVKVSKTDTTKRMYQTSMVRHSLYLLAEHLNSFAYSLAFPEMAVPTILALRGVVKSSSVIAFQKQCKRLLAQIEAQAQWVSLKRDTADLSPKDVQAAEEYLSAEREAASAPFSKWFASEVVSFEKEEAKLQAEGQEEGFIRADDDEEELSEKREAKAAKGKEGKANEGKANEGKANEGKAAKGKAKEGKAKESKAKESKAKGKTPKELPPPDVLPDMVDDFNLSDLDD